MFKFGGTRFNKGKSALVAGTLVVLAVGGGEVVATAEDPAGDRSVVTQEAGVAGDATADSGAVEPQGRKLRRMMSRQTRMDAWIASIRGEQYSLDFNGPKGFGGVSLDPDEGLVTFAWKGEPGRRVARKLARPPKGVSVAITPAAYTQAELKVAADKLRTSRTKLRKSTGWSLVVVSPSQTGSGLDAQVVAVSGADQDPLGSIQGAFSNAAGVAVMVSEGERVVQTQGPRWKPTSSWRAGAALMTPKGGVCSSGVAGKGSGGENVFLMARHCGWKKGKKYYAKNGNTWTSKGPEFGKVFGSLEEHDTLLVGTTGAVNALVYDGPWNAPKSDYRTIGSSGDSVVGDYVCTSGAMSGVHCPLRVTATNTGYWKKYKKKKDVWRSPMDVATASSGIAVAQGDSGGPVFMVSGPGKLRQARGLISALSGQMKCPSIAITKGPKCGNSVYYAPIKRALSDFKVKLVHR
ncbi:MAG: hypothetical protein U0904_02520 [Candidatus Nanopelagicales bacterium]|nr:hypothetical protein [Candidatus Nanopelagicales bacterium]